MIPFASILLLSILVVSRIDQYLGRDASNITNGKSVIDLDQTKQVTSAKDYGTKQPTTADIQNNLASVDNGNLKDARALSSNLSQHQHHEGDNPHPEHSDRCVCDDRGVKETTQYFSAESLNNAGTVSEAKTQQVNIENGVSVPKESASNEVKSESTTNRLGSNIGNRVVVALALAMVGVSVGLMPKASIQLLHLLQVGCLLWSFMFLRCGELIKELHRRRNQNDIAQGDRGDSPTVEQLIYGTADLVYEDITRWCSNNWKGLDAAVDEFLLRFCSAQLDPSQGILSTSIDDVCNRIKEGLGPVYAQLTPFSPAYFVLQRVVEFNMRSLATATRGLDWTKKIDPLVVDMVTVVAVEQSTGDIDYAVGDVSPVRLEVPSGTEGGEGNLCPSKLLQSWLNSLHTLLKAATPTLTSAKTSTKPNGGASKTIGGASKNSDAKSVQTLLMAATPTLKSGGGSGSASENGDAENSPKKSATTDDWFVASVSELLKLDAAKVSFDALHRLLEFALWPATQKMAFLFEVAGMIAVDKKSDGHAFLAALDRDLAERGKLCVFQWRVELVDNIWKEKMFKWTQPSERTGDLDDEELGPYKDQVGLLNKLWKEQKGGLKFKSLPLRVLRAIRNMGAHGHDYSVYVLNDGMEWLVDTLFPSLFPFVAGAVMHKLSELHRLNASSLSKGERWFLEHGIGAWKNAQQSPSNDVEPFLNAVHQLREARAAKSPQRASK